MLSEFDPTEKMEQVLWRHGRLKCKYKKEMGKIITRIKSGAWTYEQNNMYYVPKQYQKLEDISDFTGNFLYLCQRFWSHILQLVFTQLNMNLNSQKNLTLLKEFNCSKQINFNDKKW